MKYVLIVLALMSMGASGMSHAEFKERECLALNIYFEARGETYKDQLDIGYVTLNRVLNSRFPNNICGVVKQSKQFSWYWDGKSDNPLDTKAYNIAKHLSRYVIANPELDTTNGALFYHAHYVDPYWAAGFERLKITKAHIFYK